MRKTLTPMVRRPHYLVAWILPPLKTLEHGTNIALSVRFDQTRPAHSAAAEAYQPHVGSYVVP
jgi:hypothetical protein